MIALHSTWMIQVCAWEGLHFSISKFNLVVHFLNWNVWHIPVDQELLWIVSSWAKFEMNRREREKEIWKMVKRRKVDHETDLKQEVKLHYVATQLRKARKINRCLARFPFPSLHYLCLFISLIHSKERSCCCCSGQLDPHITHLPFTLFSEPVDHWPELKWSTRWRVEERRMMMITNCGHSSLHFLISFHGHTSITWNKSQSVYGPMNEISFFSLSLSFQCWWQDQAKKRKNVNINWFRIVRKQVLFLLLRFVYDSFVI